MAPPRRGGRPPRSFAAPELKGTLGTLLRTTLAQAGAVKDAIERSAREGRARLDDVRHDRRRADAVAELGEVVLELIRRGELADLADLPEIADALAAIDEIDARASHRERDRRDEPGRDFIAPESRSRFDRARDPERAPERGAEDGTVSSRAWTPPARAKPQARVWRPTADAAEPGAPGADDAAPRRPKRGGGIDFSATPDDAAPSGEDDDDLAEYMHPDDVPEKK